jgi:hypothetical protein
MIFQVCRKMLYANSEIMKTTSVDLVQKHEMLGS